MKNYSTVRFEFHSTGSKFGIKSLRTLLLMNNEFKKAKLNDLEFLEVNNIDEKLTGFGFRKDSETFLENFQIFLFCFHFFFKFFTRRGYYCSIKFAQKTEQNEKLQYRLNS